MQGRKADSQSVTLSTVTILQNISKGTDLGNQILDQLLSVSNSINDYFKGLSNISKPLPVAQGKPSRKKLKEVSSVTPYLSKIVDLLTDIAGKTYKKAGKQKKKDKSAEIPSVKGLKDVVSDLNAVDSTISNKLLHNMKKFGNALKLLANKKTTKLVTVLSNSMRDLAGTVKELSGSLGSTISNLKKFIRAIILTATVMMSPILTNATTKLQNFFEAINFKKKEKKKRVIEWKWMFATLALGVAALAGALIMLKFVDWKHVASLLLFIGALATVVWFATKNNKDKIINKTVSKNKLTFGVSPIIQLAFGLSVLVLAIYAIKDIDWKPAIILLGFVTAITTILVLGSVFGGKFGASGGPIFGFAMGIGILVLAIYAIGEDLNKKHWAAAGMVVAFIIAVSIAVAIANGYVPFGKNALTKGGRSAGIKGIFGFSIGIAVLAVVVWSIGENFEKRHYLAGVYLAGFIIAVGAAINLATAKKGIQIKSAQLALAIASIAGAIWIINKAVGGDWNKALTTVFTFASMVFVILAIFKLIGHKSMYRDINKGSKAIFAMKYPLLILAGVVVASLLLIGTIKDPISAAFSFSITVTVLMGIFYLVGKFDKMIRSGSRTIDKIKWSLMILSGTVAASLWIISKIESPWKSMGVLLLTVTGLMAIYAIVGIPVVAGLVSLGSATIATMQLSLPILTLSIASALYIIGQIQNPWKTMGALLLTVTGIVAIYALIGIPPVAALVAIGGLAMISMSVSLLIMSTALYNIGRSNLDTRKIDQFKYAFKEVLSLYKDVGIVGAIKIGKKAKDLKPLMDSAYEFSKTLYNISLVNLKEGQIQGFIGSFKSFLDVFSEEVQKSVSKMDKMAPGIESLSKIVGVGSGFANIAKNFANLHFFKYKINKDGQIVPYGEPIVINDTMMTAIGRNFAKLINSIINGMGEIANKGRSDRKAEKKVLERVKLLGESLSEITNVLGTVTAPENLSFLMDPGKIDKVNRGLLSFVSGALSAVDRVSVGNDINKDKLTTFNQFLTQLNTTKWDTVNKGLVLTEKNISKISKSVNAIQLQKLIELKDTMKLFTQMKFSVDQLTAIEKVIEMIDKMNGYQEAIANNQGDVAKSSAEIAKMKKAEMEAIEKAKGQELDAATFMTKMDEIKLALTALMKGDDLDVNIVNQTIPINVKIVN